MQTLIITIVFMLSSFLLKAQIHCNDTLFNTSLYHPSFKYLGGYTHMPIVDNDSATYYSAIGILIKKNKNNRFLWKRNVLAMPKFITNSNNIIGLFEKFDPLSPTNGNRGFAKINSDGSILWAKNIASSNPNYNGYNLIFNTIKGKNDDLVFTTFLNSNSFSLTILDSNAATIKLNKNYKINFLNNETSIDQTKSFTLNDNFIYITLVVNKTLPNQYINTSYLLALKINYFNGDIVATNYLNFDDELFSNNFYGFRTKFVGGFSVQNVKLVQKEKIVIAGKLYMNNMEERNRFNIIELDTNLIVKRNKIYKYPYNYGFDFHSDNLSVPFISQKGNVLFASIKDTIDINGDRRITGDCYYFGVDSTLNIATQQLQNIAETGLYSAGYRLDVIPFLKYDKEGEIIYQTNFSEADSVLHIVQLNDKIKANNCMGNPTNLITTETPTYTIHPNPQITVTEGSTLTLTPFTLPTVTNEVVEERKFCQQISICDTIKIHGNTKYCLSSPTASFTVYKNPQCLRKIKWVINDSTSIKMLNTPNDSTINVQFLKPYHGYIYAEVDGCVLKDSMFIDVNKPMPFLNIGNDTMLCPNKTITLQAALGFKTYTWQDGSTANSYTVTQAGTYSLTTTDSCDNVFTDTIKIKPNDINFLLNYPNSICLYDTATIPLTSKLKNYTWSPVNTGIKVGNTLQFYPTQTTSYTVTAERLPGCLFTDTVLIKVENCPTYVIFPTAFTPNNDFKNDVFKAVTMGKIEQYELKIYNRYGAVVFNTKAIGKGWAGAIQGIPQPTGAYIWVCSYKLKNNPVKVINGTVLLLR